MDLPNGRCYDGTMLRVPNLGETDLLVPLHEGVFEQPMWRTFLSRLRAVAGVGLAALVIRPPEGGASVRLTAGEGDAAIWLEQALLAGAAMRESRVYSGVELHETGAPAQPCPLRAMRLDDESGLSAVLVLAGEDDPGVAAANLMAALSPHLRAAMRVLAGLERERARASLGADMASRMNFGWIAIDARCRIVDCDPQAERFLQQAGALRRGPYDRLTPSAPAVDRQLTELARTFAADRKGRPRAINLSQDPWIDILVAPVALESAALDSKAVAAVYFRGDRSSVADRREQLAELFDLTPAEARLAWSMAQGMAISDAAELHGLTVETARYYSKRIYAKTGARGQVDLVRNILTGVLALA